MAAARRSAAAAGSAPSTETLPALGRIRPSISFISVVLPAPLCPTSATVSPALSRKETSPTASCRP